MKSPTLYECSMRELMQGIARRAKEYVPQWRYEQDPADPGAAIAALFAQMHYQTIDRFNLLPEKLYTEFLNMLEVEPTVATPASGFVQFEVGGMGGEPVTVPAGTEVFAADEEGEHIVFQTERKIEAFNANLRDVYYIDATGEHIEKLNMKKAQTFFAPAGNDNLQMHRFAIAHDSVLMLAGPCEIEVTIEQTVRFQEQATAAMLANPACAHWLYYNGEGYVSFDKATASGSVVTLAKDNADRLMPDESGHICVYCDVQPQAGGAIMLKGARLISRQMKATNADALSHNDIPIHAPAGGYCFGRMPAAYETFYIRSDDVFSKQGAHVNLKFDITPIIVVGYETEAQYTFNKRIIDKKDAVRAESEDVYVQQVVWEYFNGVGWAPFEVSGNTNPFSGKYAGELVLQFEVPDTFAKTTVNAQEGYYVRARVINVENYLSQIPKRILPFVKRVECAYNYTKSMRAEHLFASNNGTEITIEDSQQYDDVQFLAYQSLPPHPRAMYLCFDESPHAAPLSLMIELWGKTVLKSKVIFEAYRGGRFEQLRVIDKTDNLRYTGVVFLYLPEPLEEASFFGVDGYWLRMSLSTYDVQAERAPVVHSLRFNVVAAVQMQRADSEYFNTETYDAGKVIALMEKPVLSEEVWVDELSGISTSDMLRLECEQPERIKIERVNDIITRCWVKWERIDSLFKGRHGMRLYQLDAREGVIRFGKGTDGMVPPRGDLNIRVSYTYGGGTKGNLPAGAVHSLVGSIPRISSVTNITPMSGGTDFRPMEKTEQLGNKRLRHRGRAVGLQDFEEIVLEQFERAARVKCFANTDAKGAPAPGHICIVIMGRDFYGEHMMEELCRESYQYLSERCDCNLIADGRLHVVPSMDITVSVQVEVALQDLDYAAVTQQQVADAISALINGTWRMREIGQQINIHEIYHAVRGVKNIVSTLGILPEGSFFKEGKKQVCALDSGEGFPFATVRDGMHSVRVK